MLGIIRSIRIAWVFKTCHFSGLYGLKFRLKHCGNPDIHKQGNQALNRLILNNNKTHKNE